jgi:hypothetical protein
MSRSGPVADPVLRITLRGRWLKLSAFRHATVWGVLKMMKMEMDASSLPPGPGVPDRQMRSIGDGAGMGCVGGNAQSVVDEKNCRRLLFPHEGLPGAPNVVYWGSRTGKTHACGAGSGS